MKHLVTIMVDGQPMEATIRLGEDATEDADATGEAVALSAEAPASNTKERIVKFEQELTQLKAELK